MTATTDLQTLLAQVATVAAAQAHAHALSKQEAVVACRQLEGALVAALGGAPLRGLKNLGHGPLACYGIRVRSAPDSRRASWKLLWDQATLVLDHTGHLIMAHWHQVPGEDEDVLDLRPVRDDELHTTDVTALLRCLEHVLPLHLAAAEGRETSHAQVQALIARIGRVVAGE